MDLREHATTEPQEIDLLISPTEEVQAIQRARRAPLQQLRSDSEEDAAYLSV